MKSNYQKDVLGMIDTPNDPFASPSSRRPETLKRPRYGVDALPVPVLAGTAALACCLAAARWRTGRIATATAGAVLLANTGVFLHTTLRGKLRVWERELDRLGLAGSEQLLDLGCGRGAVLIAAARRLPRGPGR